MPSGLLIDLNDGGKPMEITAGLRCPSYGGTFDAGYGKNKYVDIAGYVPGAQVVPIITQTAYYDAGLLHRMLSVTISGGRVTQNSKMKAIDITERNSTYTFSGSVWQIYPVGQKANNGLLISDSTDFTSITSATQSGQCIYMATVNVGTGGWSIPTISGYDKKKYVVFAKWNSENVLDFDGSTIRFFSPPSGANEVPKSGTVSVVIFASGTAPTPGLGLNISNSQGVCTFSTTKRPFVYLNGLWTPSTSAFNLNGGYVPIGRFGFYSGAYGSNYSIRMFGMVMQNGAVRCEGGKLLGFNNYQIFNSNVVGGISLPILPNMYL